MKLVRRYLIALSLGAGGTIFGLSFDVAGLWPKLLALVLTLTVWVTAFKWYHKVKQHFGEFCETKMDARVLARVAIVHIIVGVVILAVTIYNGQA